MSYPISYTCVQNSSSSHQEINVDCIGTFFCTSSIFNRYKKRYCVQSYNSLCNYLQDHGLELMTSSKDCPVDQMQFPFHVTGFQSKILKPCHCLLERSDEGFLSSITNIESKEDPSCMQRLVDAHFK